MPDSLARFEEKGQRKYGGPPPGWTGPPPPRGCEVFVGKLPRSLYEQDLLPVLSKVGTVYELRLMVDFSGSNKGYCFTVYSSHEEAKRACQQLNNFEIQPGKHIGVVMSVDNRRLFVGGIPRERAREEVRSEMHKLAEGVTDVILYPSATDKSKNRGFAFVEFDSHKSAAVARQKLIKERVQLWGQPICVDWAEPEQEVDEETMANVKILYVRNLMLSTSEEQLRQLFEGFRPGSVERVKKLKDYAFVHFFSRQDAAFALEKSNGTKLDGADLEVVWAKPPDRSIMRYVKSVQKVGGQMLPPGPTVHQSIVAAASQMYAAAANGNGHISNGHHLGSSGSLTPPSPPSSLVQQPILPADPVVWAYTGLPFIDPGYAAYQQAMNVANDRMSGCSRVTRGAAGMRAAGFQAFVNNQVRKNRRRYAEAALMYELVPAGVPQMSPVPGPMLPPGLVFVPALPQPMASSRPGFVEQLEHHCVKCDWGLPSYELLQPPLLKEGGGTNVPCYIYKVTIPGLTHYYPNGFMQQQTYQDMETAKEQAALFTLLNLGLPLPQMPLQPPSHLAHNLVPPI